MPMLDSMVDLIRVRAMLSKTNASFTFAKPTVESLGLPVGKLKRVKIDLGEAVHAF